MYNIRDYGTHFILWLTIAKSDAFFFGGGVAVLFLFLSVVSKVS